MAAVKNTSRSLPLWLYLLGLGFFVYLFFQILGFVAEDSHNLLLSGLYFIEFGVHEVSHIVTAFLPPIATAAAGSIGEVIFTLLLLIATIRGRAYFGAVFAGLWVMLALHNVGRYMADARSQLLPLVGPSEAVQHDWAYVFGQIGWLNSDVIIGGSVAMIGVVVGIGALLWGAIVIVLKITRKGIMAVKDNA